MKIKILLFIFFLITPCFAQTENVNLNRDLRYTERRIDDIENTRATVAYVDSKFSTTDSLTWHHHDGTDSKKVLATDLDLTGTTDTQALYNNAGAVASKAFPSGLSNAIFSFGCAQSGNLITFVAGSESYSTDTILTKFRKITDISTVTVWVQLKVLNLGDQAKAQVTIGGQSGTVTGTFNQATWEWKSITVNVSSLTAGTTYDVTIELGAMGNDTVYMGSIIAIGS